MIHAKKIVYSVEDSQDFFFFNQHRVDSLSLRQDFTQFIDAEYILFCQQDLDLRIRVLKHDKQVVIAIFSPIASCMLVIMLIEATGIFSVK